MVDLAVLNKINRSKDEDYFTLMAFKIDLS